MTRTKDIFMEEREAEAREASFVELFDQNYPVSKTTIAMQAKIAVDTILEKGSPINAAQLLKAAEEYIDCVRKDKRLVDYVREELAKSPKGCVTLASGTLIKQAEVGTEYDFSNCNDPVYAQLAGELEKTKESLKERVTFLKTVPPKGMNLLVGDDEMVTVYPPAKKSTSSYAVTLAK